MESYWSNVPAHWLEMKVTCFKGAHGTVQSLIGTDRDNFGEQSYGRTFVLDAHTVLVEEKNTFYQEEILKNFQFAAAILANLWPELT